ncbi:MAG: Gfo/Idh/MocA family oxidoreductase, partial [Corynebacterium sp.]|uniref:Gfo/Idh/MocA family oxidoreductase n=1 Tax=Corynebacterium sp. TaxID=1720 RepID=UPI003F9A1F56
TRRDLVLRALEAGVSVVADKPFAPDAVTGEELVRAADERGLVLNVFHNRRFDTDIVTARGVVDGGALGTVRGLDLRLDLDEPESVESGPQGGLLRDLGSHVVDQALTLMGPAVSVYARLDSQDRAEGETNVRFLIVLGHRSGAVSRISASKVDHLVSKEVRIFGDDGSYVSDFTDVQAEAVKRGKRPAGRRADWGYEDASRWGVLRTDSGEVSVPSAQGDYTCFYDGFAGAVAHGGAGPVPGTEGVEVLRVLDAVAVSAREGRTVAM